MLVVKVVQLLHSCDPFILSFACKFPICEREVSRCKLKHLLFNFIDTWMGHDPTAQLGLLRIANCGLYLLELNRLNLGCPLPLISELEGWDLEESSSLNNLRVSTFLFCHFDPSTKELLI